MEDCQVRLFLIDQKRKITPWGPAFPWSGPLPPQGSLFSVPGHNFVVYQVGFVMEEADLGVRTQQIRILLQQVEDAAREARAGQWGVGFAFALPGF